MESYIDYLKEGSGIHIKKKNRGKFTKSAKAAGEGVQEHAHKVMNDPNATPLQKKRANFAIQSKKWHKHFEGGVIKAADGASLFINTKRAVDKNKDRLTDEQYKQAILEISNSSDIPELELQTPEKVEKSIVATEESLQQPWTTAYRIGDKSISDASASSATQTTAVKPDMSKVRSDRNNNPLNIRFTNIAWQGKKTDGKSDNDFEEFESRDYGWRAAYKNIETKMNRGVNTITKLISEWAPPSENNTNGYIQYVASKTGIDPNAVITRADLPKIGAAMAAIESGRRDNIDWDDALRGFKFYLGQPV